MQFFCPSKLIYARLSGITFAFLSFRHRFPFRHPHQRRPQNPLAELVAPLHLADDLALLVLRALLGRTSTRRNSFSALSNQSSGSLDSSRII